MCGLCGTELPAHFKFCSECGTAVASSPTPAEYKQVTVLFADVVHSMDIAATVGAERLREIMADLADRCAAVVQHYGSALTQFTGDGIMAVFGAPVALEDHAVRACLAALDVQQEAARLAVDVNERDGIELCLRVGLNSGEVIAGGIGSGHFGYSAIGEQVGMAQRMESVAPPGGIMLSTSTARLVEGAAALGKLELVQIKGSRQPVPARQLLAMTDRHHATRRAETSLVGRCSEMAAATGWFRRATRGHGSVVGVVGSPGIGKSRLVRDVVAIARRHQVEVFTTFCESHASDIPFHVVAQLLRATIGIEGLSGQIARHRVRKRLPDADPEDLLLIDDLLSIADAAMRPPKIDPDSRRQRLTALVNAALLARTVPTVFVIEDAHWIDEVSESLLAEFLSVTPQTPSLVLVTYRPGYVGALARFPDQQTIALSPLSDTETKALVSALLGADPSVGVLGEKIAARAAGNPFFAEELVRELAERGTLFGNRGAYLSSAEVDEVQVPATLQSAIAARIDRLDPKAKRTLGAAAVLGARFTADLLQALGIDPLLEDLIEAELIDQMGFTEPPEYVFHHPLIRTVAYASQLKSDRAELHRRAAGAIESGVPEAVDENAALIAEHLQAAGELSASYDWHMRAATWSTNRDLAAARVSWERARRIADLLPIEDPDQLSKRIAPRTMLCATDIQVRTIEESRTRFAELQELCRSAGDSTSLAIGMSALAGELCFAGRVREAAQLSSQQMELLESIGDITSTMVLSAIAFINWLRVGEFGEILRWSQSIVDVADGDPTKGAGFGVGSPLAIALAWRGTARWCLGQNGWRQDLHDAVAMARNSNVDTRAPIVAWSYGFAMHYGVLRANDSAVREALQNAQQASDGHNMDLITYTLAVSLLNQNAPADRSRGLKLMLQARDIWQRDRAVFLIPVTDVWVGRETARCGNHDAGIAAMREAVDELHRAGNLFYGIWASSVLVETLLERGASGDLADAEQELHRLAGLRSDQGSAMREITLLRLHALVAGARGAHAHYLSLRERYRDMAKTLGFEGHIAWAEAMP